MVDPSATEGHNVATGGGEVGHLIVEKDGDAWIQADNINSFVSIDNCV
jgi:hypothetical protein